MRKCSPYLRLYFVSFLIVASCSKQKEPIAGQGLHFNWGTPVHFQVVESIVKKNTELQILHDCVLTQTNGEYELSWPNAKIVEFDGQNVDESKDLMRALQPIQTSFRYPSFRISGDGQFLDTMNLNEAVQQANQMLDQVVTNRTEDSRRALSQYGKSETGRQTLNQVFGSIWETWVGAWVDVNLADGHTALSTNVSIAMNIQAPATARISNMGPIASHPEYIGLKYEQEVSITNFTAMMNKFIDKMAEETDIPSAGPITNQCSMRQMTILQVQTDRQTLKPHWAKESVKTILIIRGEETETNFELHDYQFLWNGEPATEFSRWQ